MSRTYRTGQKPSVGDTIKLVNAQSDSGYWNDKIRLSKDKTHTVTQVVESSASTLVVVKGTASSFKASRFDLTVPSVKVKEKGPASFLVMSSDGKVLGLCWGDETLREKLRDLLKSSPTLEYHVYKYYTTAITPEPTVEFVNRTKPMVSLSQATALQEPVERPSDDQPFR